MSALASSHSETLDANPNPKTKTNPIESNTEDQQHPLDSDRPSSGEGTPASGVDPAISGEDRPDDQEEEEELECGFCLFMKGGGCKDEFIAWENCIQQTQETGEDVVDKCFEVTSILKKCMDAHADYYEPVLRAEQAMADAVEAPESEN